MYCKEDNRNYYSLSDANFITGVSAKTLRKRIDDEDLDAYQLNNGGKWRIEANELIDYAYWEWNRGKCLMLQPHVWQSRMDHIDNKQRRVSSNGTKKRIRPITTATK